MININPNIKTNINQNADETIKKSRNKNLNQYEAQNANENIFKNRMIDSKDIKIELEKESEKEKSEKNHKEQIDSSKKDEEVFESSDNNILKEVKNFKEDKKVDINDLKNNNEQNFTSDNEEEIIIELKNRKNKDNDNNENNNNIYDKSTNSLFSINKSGTLNIYQLITKEENKLDYNTITNLTNKFNDQSITEIYLYFSISFICLNDSTYILVSSNKGRIFLYNTKNNEFKEIAENPHKNSIYSIIFNSSMNQIIFFSHLPSGRPQLL